MGTTHEGLEEFTTKTTYGVDKYRKIVEDNGRIQIVEGRAELHETIPVYKSCGECEKYLAKHEVNMAPYMIALVEPKEIINPVTGRSTKIFTNPKQNYICFECFEEMIK